jgi:hypothetical protein
MSGLLALSFLISMHVILVDVGDLAADDSPGVEAGQAASTSVSRPAELAGERASDGSHTQAVDLLRAVIEMVVHGPAFDAKVRETVWTTGRSVVGVGTYEQAGGGSGRYNLLVTMHDGDGKHRLQQISDGRLAWTRTEIAGKVSLRRVDVGLLDQWVEGAIGRSRISPRLKVGAWAEMLSTIERNYVLEAVGAKLKDDQVWVIKGKLRDHRRHQIMAFSGLDEWPDLYPTQVRVAIKSKPDPDSGFGAWLPVRIEYLSDPVVPTANSADIEPSEGRLISLIEIYSIRPIDPPPEQRFRFENRDAHVNFINETDRYIQHYGVELTERQRRQLQR